MSRITLQKISFGTPAYDEAIQLRTAILRVPLGLEFYAADLQKEFDQLHLAAYDTQGIMIGVLTLLPLDKATVKMRQVAVRADRQGAGVGRKLVVESELIARQLGAKNMVLHARDVAIPFYKKLGYQSVGKMFKEVNIPHYKMEKNL